MGFAHRIRLWVCGELFNETKMALGSGLWWDAAHRVSRSGEVDAEQLFGGENTTREAEVRFLLGGTVAGSRIRGGGRVMMRGSVNNDCTKYCMYG